MLVRVRPLLVAVGAALALTGCATASPSTPAAGDADRLAAMRAEPVYAHLVGDPDAAQGREEDGTYLATTYDAPVDPWGGQDPPVGPSMAQRQSAVADLVALLRGSGWTIISARCERNDASTDAQPTADAAEDAAGEPSYLWEVFGYRLISGVPYTVHLTATYADSSGFAVRVSMATPFHGDPARYFVDQPAGLAEQATCVEAGRDDAAGAEQGTIWSLEAARG